MKLLDTVALLEDMPEKGLKKGQVGTLVEELTPDVFEVEFCDLDGRTAALAAIHVSKLMSLLHAEAASG